MVPPPTGRASHPGRRHSGTRALRPISSRPHLRRGNGGGMNYFVTGATGFIGRHLVEELLKREGTIYALVREGSRGRLEELGDKLGAGERLVPVVGDLSKEGLGVEGFDEKIDHFFHLAAIYDRAASEEEMMPAKGGGPRHVVEFVNSSDVGRFHHT